MTVNIPADALGGAMDIVTVTIRPQSGGNTFAAILLTTTANIVYGSDLGSSKKIGEPGSLVIHTLTITNTGNVTDRYTMTIVRATWPLTALGAVGPMVAGNSAATSIEVKTPDDGSLGSSDIATITLTSYGDPSKLTTATLTTTIRRKVYLPLILKE